MITWAQIGVRQDYEDQRYDFLLAVEERGDVKLTPYNDNPALNVAGNISIGLGFNLESSATRDAVFQAFGLVRNNPALSDVPSGPGQLSARQIENNYIDQLIAQLRVTDQDFSTLHTIMANRAADNRLAALGSRRAAFEFEDESEVKTVFNQLMTTIYEPLVDCNG